MRLLQLLEDGSVSYTQDLIRDIPPYAILSHTWEDDEVTFKDLQTKNEKTKAGYNKLRFCGEQAQKDGLQYFWVDTCAIDKSNNNELSEAINSMYRWYRNAVKCYVYLSDVSDRAYDGVLHNQQSIVRQLRMSRWFTRGWTLQELIAPLSVIFFEKHKQRIGDKTTLEKEISEITEIPIGVLRGYALSKYTVEQRMRWAANRSTTREEDQAYCLLGIFDVSMPLVYGEGKRKAEFRLQDEISKLITNTLLDGLPYPIRSKLSDVPQPSMLNWAVQNGHSAVVDKLLSLDAVNFDVNDKGDFPVAPVIHAAKEGFCNIVKTLIQYGADVNTVDSRGRTGLSYAAQEGHDDVVEHLLQYGANPNMVDDVGSTALLWAACRGKDAIVRRLLQVADINLTPVDEEGMTPLFWAIERSYGKIAEDLANALGLSPGGLIKEVLSWKSLRVKSCGP